MSRTKKGAKSPGYDYWGKRGMADKETTKSKERAQRRQQISKIKKGKDE